MGHRGQPRRDHLRRGVRIAVVLRAPCRLEIDKIKGSRFLGIAVPVADAESAEAELAAIRGEFPEATHHCWAWRIEGDDYRFSDDGEPNGTAGKPIFTAITSRGLRGTLVVVVRWYGGTKLGTGGLVRAYGAAAAAVLDAADTETWVATRTFVLTFDYADEGAVKSVLHAHEAEELDAEYAARVTLRLRIPEADADTLVTALTDRTSGRASIR